MSKQSVSVDYALYAMATLTHLAHDSTIVVFDQDEMRSHLLTILENNPISDVFLLY